MEIREPIGILYNCNFLEDAKSSNFLDSLFKPRASPKEYFSPLEENFKSPRLRSPIASDVKIRTYLSCSKDFRLGITMIQTRAVKMEDSLSYWVKSSQIGPYVQIKNCISELFKTNMW